MKSKPESNLFDLLYSHWGYSNLKPLQAAVVDAVLSNRDTIAVLPTGYGKSICYQLPALMKEGVCLVISPLIALMNDQVSGLKNRNIRAECIHSGNSRWKNDQLLDNAIYGNTKILYLSPESLKSKIVIARIKQMNISLIAVDEAHCISQWGHDFRPSYRTIADLRKLCNAPFLAITATANKLVVHDILKSLELNSPFISITAPRRENLSFNIIKTENKRALLCQLIKQTDESVILYVNSRRDTRSLSQYLIERKISALSFHGGMNTKEKNENQGKWLKGKHQVMVCTNAFGMGIDKSNVRLVLHLKIPPSIEEYVQETGRAGRDGKSANVYLLLNESDFDSARKQIKQAYPDPKLLSQVYQHLCISQNLAIGSHMEAFAPLDISKLAEKLGLTRRQVFYCSRVLSQLEIILFNDKMFNPSKILIFRSQILEFQRIHGESHKLVILIKVLLRLYEGIIFELTKINERTISKKMDAEIDKTIGLLKKMESLGLAEYHESFDLPSFKIAFPRVSSDSILYEAPAYINRRKIAEDKQELMIALINSDICRQVKIDEYFDTPNNKNCGICDNCVNQKTQSRASITAEALVKMIPNNGISIEELEKNLSEDKIKSTRETLSKLIEERIIKYKNKRFFKIK